MGKKTEQQLIFENALYIGTYTRTTQEIRGANLPCIYSLLSIIYLYTQFLCIHGSTATDSTNPRLNSTAEFSTEKKKKSMYKWTVQFKPMMFKGQVYVCMYTHFKIHIYLKFKV